MLLARLSAPLLYLATALLLLYLAHRAVRPLTRRAALVLLLLPLCFTGRAFVTGQAYGPINLAYGSEPLSAFAGDFGVKPAFNSTLHDLYTAIIPWHEAVRHAFSLGEWPLLNPFVLCGDPLAGSAQPAPFYPLSLLALLVPMPFALGYLAALHYLAAALGAFLLARELDCREEAAAVAAVGWMASGFVLFWLEWPLGMTIVHLPLVLLGVRRCVTTPGRGSVLLLTAGLSAALLAGHPESAAHLVGLGMVYGLVQLAGQERRVWAGAFGRGILAGALALGLTAIFTFPLLDTLTQTFQWHLRQGQTSHVEGAASFDEVGQRLLPSLVPFVYGFGAQRIKAVPAHLTPLASAYAGSLLLALALFGLARSRSRERWVWAGLLVLALAAGGKVPGFYELLAHVPPFQITLNDRLIATGGLALALLAALGAEAWLRSERPRSLAWVCLATTAGLGLVLAGLWGALRQRGLPEEFLSQQGALLLVVPALAGLALLVPRLRGRGLALVCALLVAQRVAEMGWFYPSLPAEIYYPKVRPLNFDFPREEPFRAVGFQYALIPNLETQYGLEDPRGYQAIHHLGYLSLFSLWSAASPADWFPRVDRLERPFLSFLNVRFALVPKGLRPPGWRLVERGRSLWLWRNPRVQDRAFLPRRIRSGGNPGAYPEEMKAAEDFAELAWIEPPGELPAPAELEVPNGRGKVAIRRRGLGFHLSAEIEEQAWVVISNVAWRGWRARSGGRELPLGVANHAFLALELPPGQHEVELFFRPRSFEIGLGVSAATAALLAAALALTRRRRREEPAERRLGDHVEIDGAYQFRALHEGRAPQRFWHWAKLTEALESLALAPGDRLLDAGCGSGLAASMAAERPGVEVLGVDANPAAIAFAEKTFARPNLRFELGLVDELGLPAASFEKIVFLEVIEHLTQKQGEETLRHFHRLLAPGGRLVLSTPNRRSPWPMIEWTLDRFRLVPNLGEEQHEHLYSRGELEGLAEASGYQVLEVKMINTVAPWLALLSERLARVVHRLEARFLPAGGSILVVTLQKRPDA